jgi:hypothetical protein
VPRTGIKINVCSAFPGLRNEFQIGQARQKRFRNGGALTDQYQGIGFLKACDQRIQIADGIVINRYAVIEQLTKAIQVTGCILVIIGNDDVHRNNSLEFQSD